jgi:ABC-type branched-subunit amino acid transport system substrate-binding protein
VALLTSCAGPAQEWRGLVKIGLVLPFHGPTPAAAMDAHVTIRQRLIDRNRAGGLNGWRLELVSLDDQNDPAVADLRLRELTLDPDVVAVLTARSADIETLDRLLDDVAAGLAAGATPRGGLRERLRER